MKSKIFRYVPVVQIGLLLVGLAFPTHAQSAPPIRETLLNGLTILFWPRPGDANVLLKLRINNGAAFDLANKAGTMSLLGDALFPDPATREYVSEQLGGRLEVATNYDWIEVTLSGKASELERMIEFLRNALITTNLSADTVAKVREARLQELTAHPVPPAELADGAIAKRLFGSFPYANPPTGTPETLAKIDRADLMLAQERFLHADSASLAVIGGIEKARLMRALRQLLGPWQKADRTFPLTFREPNAPDSRVLVLNEPGARTAEIRLAVRGVARSDRDFAAATLLAQVARERWQSAAANLSSPFVRNEAHALPGMFVFGATAPASSALKAVTSAQDVLRTLAQNGSTATELDRARSQVLADTNQQASQLESAADARLDIDTYKLPANSILSEQIGNVSAADIQRVATRLVKMGSPAIVVVGDADQLKSSFGANIEIRGLSSSSAAPTATPPGKP